MVDWGRGINHLGLLDQLGGPARGFDGRLGALGELVRVHGQLLGQLAAAEDLHRDVALAAQSGGLQRGQVDRRAVLEAPLRVADVDRLRVGAERLEGHGHLLVRPAQLAHPHVDRVLAPLEARAVLGSRAGAVALVAAPRGLAVAAAVAAADALAIALGPRRRLQRMQADRLGGQLFLDGALLVAHLSSTVIRWRTAWTMPRSCGESGRSTVLPMPRRPSESSVSRWRGFEPLDDLTCVMTSVMPRPPPTRPPSRPLGRRRCRRGPARGLRSGRAAPRPPRAGAAPAGR